MDDHDKMVPIIAVCIILGSGLFIWLIAYFISIHHHLDQMTSQRNELQKELCTLKGGQIIRLESTTVCLDKDVIK